MNNMDVKVKEIEDIIEQFLPREEGYQITVLKAMNYTMRAGGKRLRPMLMEETYRLFNGSGEEIKPFMAAIEMIHTYSLIHDDLPALDNDDYRRGKKTAHVVFGEAIAILAGDGLLNYAFETAAKAFTYGNNQENIAKAFIVLTKKPGIYGMIGGQVADVELTGTRLNSDQIKFIYECKTAALVEASMMIGAILAGASDEEVSLIEKIARNIGLAFQIQDDILDLVGEEDIIGKPVHSDERNDKVTYATIHGIEKAKIDVDRISKEAVADLDGLSYKNDFLRALIISLINREK